MGEVIVIGVDCKPITCADCWTPDICRVCGYGKTWGKVTVWGTNWGNVWGTCEANEVIPVIVGTLGSENKIHKHINLLMIRIKK